MRRHFRFFRCHAHVVRRCKLSRLETRIASAWFQRLKLKYEAQILSSFAFMSNLRHYDEVDDPTLHRWPGVSPRRLSQARPHIQDATAAGASTR